MDKKLPIFVLGERVFSNSQKAMEISNSKHLGEKSSGKVVYSFFEAFYLFELKRAEIIDARSEKSLSEEKIISLFSKKESNFFIKYLVFRKLRQKGYFVKTGSKFGAEFRVYENSINSHAKWLVYPIKQGEKQNWDEFISKNRVAHSTGKKILLGIVDSEDNVLFYETSWVKL